MSEAGFCLFIGNITVKLLLLLAATARGYSHTHAHAETLTQFSWYDAYMLILQKFYMLEYFTEHFSVMT